MFDESKNEYVSRKVDAFRKDYVRTREREGLPVDEDVFPQLTLDVRHGAEDWWDFWHGEGS